MDRWWDDAGAARAALAVVDSTDPVQGVGTAVLGYHALAKAELEPLAKSTLVDTAAVQRAMSRVPLEPVAKAVERAVSDDLGAASAHYSRAFVENLHRDAVEAAVRVTQTLVNKGLPWPRAMARTADVVGAPLRDLGRYTHAMSGVGLDQLAVSDAADRVLMGFASRISSYEASPVSKALERERGKKPKKKRKPWNEAEVRRDEEGQFAAKENLDRLSAAIAARAARNRVIRRTPAAEQERETPQFQESTLEREETELEREPTGSGGTRPTLVSYSGPSTAPVLAPGAGGNATPFVVAEDLYVIVSDHGSGPHLIARTRPEFIRYAMKKGWTQNRPRDQHSRLPLVRVFDPNTLPVLGYDQQNACFLIDPSLYEVEEVERPQTTEMPAGFIQTAVGDTHLAAVYARRTRARVPNINIVKALERERKGKKKHRKRPWDETKVRRDEDGQFAQQARTDEAMRRIAERARRLNAWATRSPVLEEQQARDEALPQFQERVPEREEAVLDREAVPTSGPDFPQTEKFLGEMQGPYYVATVTGARNALARDLGLRITDYNRVIDFNDVILTLFDENFEEETMNLIHQVTGAILDASENADSSIDFAGLVSRGWNDHGRNVGRLSNVRVTTLDREVHDHRIETSGAMGLTGVKGMEGAHYATHSDKDGYVYTQGGTLMHVAYDQLRKPNWMVVAMTPEAHRDLDFIRTLSGHRQDKAALKAARSFATEVSRSNGFVTPTDDADRIAAIAQARGLKIEFAPADVYREMANHAMTTNDLSQVRLDGFDILKIY